MKEVRIWVLCTGYYEEAEIQECYPEHVLPEEFTHLIYFKHFYGIDEADLSIVQYEPLRERIQALLAKNDWDQIWLEPTSLILTGDDKE